MNIINGHTICYVIYLRSSPVTAHWPIKVWLSRWQNNRYHKNFFDAPATCGEIESRYGSSLYISQSHRIVPVENYRICGSDTNNLYTIVNRLYYVHMCDHSCS